MATPSSTIGEASARQTRSSTRGRAEADQEVEAGQEDTAQASDERSPTPRASKRDCTTKAAPTALDKIRQEVDKVRHDYPPAFPRASP
jgi:hypothetical protein